MKTFKFISDSILAIIDEDGISRGSCSSEHKDYLEWVAAGNTAAPYAPTAEELASEAQSVIDRNQLAEAKADAVTQYLVSHTVLEINTYFRNQVKSADITNLATATASLKTLEGIVIKLAAVVATLAKDKLR